MIFPTGSYVLGREGITMAAGYGAIYNSAFGCEGTWTNEYGKNTPLNVDLTADDSGSFMVDVVGGDMWSGPRPTPFTVTVVSGTGSAGAPVPNEVSSFGSVKALFR